MERSATDLYREYYPEKSAKYKELTRDVTFQVTERCNLQCTYCYQVNKTPKRMCWEVAKKIVDGLFKMYDDDVEGAFITSHTEMLVLDFIGGEPMLEMDLIRKICDYFWDTAIKRHHIWAETFMVSFASNGTVYFQDNVQDFFKKYKTHLSYSVSIDGTKEMHDACRVFPDGTGSFDLAKAAQDDYDKRFRHSIGTKATIAQENLPLLSTLIKYYVGQGFTDINANCVYEAYWNLDNAKMFYNQLKETADFLLGLDHKVELALFNEQFFHYKPEDDIQNWCGGTGAMLAYDPDGTAYPCIRYMPTSLGTEMSPIVIGDTESIYTSPEAVKTLEFLDSIDRRTQSTDECFYCPIAEGCSWCSAWNYQYTGSVDRRCTNICIMHKARSLANVYYWNKRYLLEGNNKYNHRFLPDEMALEIIGQEELDLLNSLEAQAKEKSVSEDPTNNYVSGVNESEFYQKFKDSVGQNDARNDEYRKVEHKKNNSTGFEKEKPKEIFR